MTRKSQNAVYAALLLALFGSVPLAAASFVYEGQLDDRGVPANGRYDVQLAVYRDAELGATLAAPMVFNAVEVANGHFRLDFDAKLDDGESAWVELAVRDVGAVNFSAIPGRTKATQAPAAIGACWSSVGDSGTNPATHFLGTTDAQPLVLRTHNRQGLRIEPSSVLVTGLPITASVTAGSGENLVALGVRGGIVAGGGAGPGDDPSYLGASGPNWVTDHYGTISGGLWNLAGNGSVLFTDADFASIGGGNQNTANAEASTISGGVSNTASGRGATIGGGANNIANSTYAAVGGGWENEAIDVYATVSGGWANQAHGTGAVVAGGQSNIAEAFQGPTVAGGTSNVATGYYSTVGGGVNNSATNRGSTAVGGANNCAGGVYSLAAGFRAKIRSGSDSGAAGAGCTGVALSGDADGDQGSFVWADSQNADFVSTGPNQFLVRAAGGMAINASDAGSSTFRVNGTIRLDTLGTNSAGAPTLCRNAGNQIALCSSSKRYKDDIADLPPSLDAVLALRPVSYRWKATGAPDIGFVAEEVAELDERLITRNDSGEIEGVKYERLSALLAGAVQELAAREQLQAREIDGLRKDLAELRALIETQRTGDR